MLKSIKIKSFLFHGQQGVKVLTLKAAKGLEFPIVAIAGFLDAAYPFVPKNAPEAVREQIMNCEVAPYL